MTPALESPVASVLEWDSAFFGFRVGRANGSRLTETTLATLLQWSAAERIRCLYLSADPQCPTTLALAAQGGFQFVDMRLELGCRLLPSRGPADPTRIVRPARPDDLPALQEIARGAHYDTRFFKDSSFPSTRAADLYAEWIRRDVHAHTVFVADFGGDEHTAGYISCLVEPATKIGRIGLLAVDGRCSGRGAGGALVRTALAWCSEQGCTGAQVVTQASNVGAQRLYQAAGFRTLETSLWFHRWFTNQNHE